MTTYFLIFIMIFVIVVISMFCFLMGSFSPKAKGKTVFEGEFELFKIFKFKFKTEHDNTKK